MFLNPKSGSSLRVYVMFLHFFVWPPVPEKKSEVEMWSLNDFEHVLFIKKTILF